MLKSMAREPLIHFLALALLIFAVYGALGGPAAEKPRAIVITEAKIEQVGALFAKVWLRPPTASELKGLIDDYVKEEIYYREALALGLDKDDTVIRRRLRQKIEFLSGAEAEALAPSEADLEAYLRANTARFEVEPAIAFRQIYLDPGRRGAAIEEDARAALGKLRTDSPEDLASFGDASLLPYELTLSDKSTIGQMFGQEFADAVVALSPDGWTGPFKSAYGLHLVEVAEKTPGRVPALAEVRDAVLREWTSERRKEREEARFAELAMRYEVVIENAAAENSKAIGR